MAVKLETLDTTLRDGAQSARISFSCADKIRIIGLLDELGIDFVEIGASDTADVDFFAQAKGLKLCHAKLTAFGSTCRAEEKAEESTGLQNLLDCNTEWCTVFGKAWDLHVTDVLRTTFEENLRMISESIRFLVQNGKKVIFDAEHFYDGYKSNPSYAVEVIQTAERAGASVCVLCDTNGGCFPDEVFDITKEATENVGIKVGIHAHNDGGMAVSNSVFAVSGGARHVQGTLNGIGERCGNANLATVMANLQLKRGFEIIPADKMKNLTHTARAVAETANITTRNLPYISRQAFLHKAGTHIDGVLKNHESFEHISPGAVGNERNFLVSGMAGRSALVEKINQFKPSLDKDSPEIQGILEEVKELESQGFQYDAADASLELVIKKALGIFKKHFDINLCRLIDEHDSEKNQAYSSVLFKVLVKGREETTAADSDGPVHAMDIALRSALHKFYPSLRSMRLSDYKVRVLNNEQATGSKIRVLIETTDGGQTWTTIGVSVNIIEASLAALVDSIEYKLNKGE
ncbi:MAG: citramalate synthase [Clostridia bacterium]|nr:citramalate synthase [Clostridia bacterium]